MSIIVYSLLALGGVALLFAAVIYFVEKKFKVVEDPRIDEIQEILPGANCGGCGYPGCRGFAEAIVKTGDFNALFCPVGGNDVAKKAAAIMGVEVQEKAPQIAVVRCNGSHEHAPKKVTYEGATSCAFAHMLFAGESTCPYGCLGCGDCVASCTFDAIYMNYETGLPVIVEDKCTSCGACVKACPRGIIELRNKGPKGKRIFVCCINKEKGAIARKNCSVACIGCGKCVKICPYEAITMTDNLAYISFEKCKLCRKCVSECPTSAIHEINFPPRKTDVKNTNEVEA
ncbi:MAG: RnfABCDGE type electron transport complex subunit B [Bacteroidales bacterium]|nr:RnfABCDGE type electron transport complex subunit B [Bacteroidales bacterium]